ncbi:MAG: sigma-70 family RNA polymerase sigma factor [Pseudomonadota bacterium]
MNRPETKALLGDEALAEQVQSGDQAAFAALAHRYGPKLAAFAGKVLLDQTIGEDVVQDAFLKFWQQPGRYDPAKAGFSTWMHKVVFNRCLDHKRRRGFAPLEDAPQQIDMAALAPDVMAANERDRAVQAAINTLPERQRAALLLCHIDGVSNQDAADILDVKLKALESLLSRARASLRSALMPMKEELL